MNSRLFRILKVSSLEKGMRLVLFLKKKTKTQLSSRLIKKALEKGLCKVNDEIESFASKRLKENDIVVIERDWEEKIQKKSFLFLLKKKPKVLYEDKFLLIIDKKPGCLCADSEIEKLFFPKKCILVHRLDRDTSGVLILAKSEKIKDLMKIQFRKKKVKKTYIAIVDGKISKNKGRVESHLKKNKSSKGKILWQNVKKNGLFALTYFEAIKKTRFYSVVKCFPITGRTHQIRVHMKQLGHPILGDYQYSRSFKYPKFVSRLMLHSLQIEFKHPIFLEKKIKVKAPLSLEFKKFM